VDKWLQYPAFLKLVQGEEVWIKTFLDEERKVEGCCTEVL
jgi:hypothetical protein